MNRSTAVLLGLVVFNAVLFAAGWGLGSDDTAGPGARARVGLVFDVGGIGDKSFNDAAYRGLKKAHAELGVVTWHIEPGDGSDRESALRQFALDGADLVIGVGFIFSEDMTRLAAEFPGVKFACIDYSVKPGVGVPDNLAGLRFREHEGSFLVGAIAGLTTTTKQVGFIGGMKIPLIRKFEAGYSAGVRYVCPDCTVRSAYAGTQPKAFADPTKGYELASAQYSRGVDIIYHASGKTGSGVFNAARERDLLAIGVDSDQFHEAPGHVLTSMVKRVDVAVFETIRAVADGEFRGGVREFGLAEDGVDFVDDGNNRSLLRRDVLKRVNEIRAGIVAGTIQVPRQ